MMSRKKKRLGLIAIIGLVLTCAIALMFFGLREKVEYFRMPTDIHSGEKPAPKNRFRLGGLVKAGSIKKDGEKVIFVLTDTEYDVAVTYTGILPDLFREGQGMVAEGVLDSANVFIADSVLAKHDENYMPKEVADALKQKGVWQGQEQSSDVQDDGGYSQ